jgi:Uncharacterized conserved protein
MTYQIKIHNFEGPFDLLFHLIEKAEVDIYDIPIADITNQYLEYITEMQSLDLEVASEFILMAATLIQIKSKMLLPKEKYPLDEMGMDGADPRAELVEQLIQYKKYKEAAMILKEKEEEYMDVFYKNAEIIDDIDEDKILVNMTLDDLVNAFNDVLKRYDSKNSGSNLDQQVIREEITVDDKISMLRDFLSNTGRAYFTDLFQDKITDKLSIIVTFLALLELIRLKEIRVYQSKPYCDILIEKNSEV